MNVNTGTIFGLIIWSAVAALIVGIGIWSWKSPKAVGFYSGVEPPKVRDVRKYNHAVACLWFVYAALFEILGLPLLAEKKGQPLFLVSILGVVFITILLMAAYNRILSKHRRD